MAPEAAAAPRLAVPEDAARTRPPPPPAQPADVSLRWRERMRGDFAGNRGTGTGIDLRLTVRAASVSRFVEDPDHRAEVSGTVTVAGLAECARIENGYCCLFVDEAAKGERAMIYVLPFRTAFGALAVLRGRKRVRGRWPWDFWRATTTMRVTVSGAGIAETAGQVRLGVAEVFRMALSLRAGGGGSSWRRLGAVGLFLRFFAISCLHLARAGWRKGP